MPPSAAARRRCGARPSGSAPTRRPPSEFVGATSRWQFEVADDDAWQRAEETVVAARTKDKGEELERIAAVLETLEQADAADEPTKWQRADELMDQHGIRPGEGQLLVFTEFADTARWLAALFERRRLHRRHPRGRGRPPRRRDQLQQRVPRRPVPGARVSTDAGGEGIDLQSAHVMIDWDIPWSLVRLEQRMGRLHRIGQKNAVHIYHLVAPATREGRVQEVMLQNLEAAGQSLGGRIFDLLDATAARAGFDYGRALVEAQRGGRLPRAGARRAGAARRRPRAGRRRGPPAHPRQHRRGDGPVPRRPAGGDQPGHRRRVRRPARPGQRTGPSAPARRRASARSPRMSAAAALGGGLERLIAADGASVRQAINDGAQGLDDVVVLGPTEEPFRPRGPRVGVRRDRPGSRREPRQHGLADRLHAAALRR